MQFSFGLVAASALSIVNAVIITNSGTSFIAVQAGSTLPITWSEAQGPVTLTLKTGPAAALTTVSVIGSGLTGSSYSWVIPSNLPDGAYALQIDDSTGVPNYSIVFPIAGGSYRVSSVAPSSSAPVSTPAPSSSPVPSSSASSSSASSSSAPASTPSGYPSVPPPIPSSTPTGYTNSSSSAKPSHSGSSKTPSSLPSGTAGTTAPPNSNSGASLASPLALVLLAFAALFTLN